MGEVEKPFSCMEKNCNMTFTNEDHLQVHRRGHEMHSLQPPLLKQTGSFVDQTPTPSKFLRHSDESALFQEMNINPFDFEFRKASDYQLAVIESNGVANESLETPLVDSDQTISSTSRDDISVAISSPTLYSNIQSNNAKVPTSSSPRVIKMSGQLLDKKEGRKRLTLNVNPGPESKEKESSNLISTPTPVITAGPSVSQALGTVSAATPSLNTPTILSANVPHIMLNGMNFSSSELNTPTISPAIKFTSTPTSVLQHSGYFEQESHSSGIHNLPISDPSPIVSSSNSVLMSPSTTVLQLVLRLPNGQSIPVEIPATPVMPSAATTSAHAICSTAPSIVPMARSYQTAVITNPLQHPSLAKMKLKEVLASSSTAARPGNARHSRATTADRIAEMTRRRSQSGGDIQDDSNSSCSSGTSNTATANMKRIRRRRNASSEESPEEKRRKFLERNRAAAVRCREKKKRLVQTIAAKSDELGIVNQKLQSEVAALRSEVASLKSLLLRHKNCPVTLAMQGESDDMEIIVPNTETITTFKIEAPSGIITEITSPIVHSSFSRGPNIKSSIPSSDPHSKASGHPLPPPLPSATPNFILSESPKMRKRSLSLSSISLSPTSSNIRLVKPSTISLPSAKHNANVQYLIGSKNMTQTLHLVEGCQTFESPSTNQVTQYEKIILPKTTMKTSPSETIVTPSLVSPNVVILTSFDGNTPQTQRMTRVFSYRQSPILCKVGQPQTTPPTLILEDPQNVIDQM